MNSINITSKKEFLNSLRRNFGRCWPFSNIFSTAGLGSKFTTLFDFSPHLIRYLIPHLILFIPGLRILLGQPKLSMSFLTQSHHIFFGRPLCLFPTTSNVMQRFTQSLSSFRSTCPNHLNLPFLIIKLTGSNPRGCLSSSLFFLLFSLKYPSDHTYFSAIHLQFMLNFHRPGLTAMHQTTRTSSVYLALQF